jgi:exopolysaccharide production protein ExoY
MLRDVDLVAEQFVCSGEAKFVGGRAKRVFDLVAALTLLIILVPLLSLVSAAIWLASPGPIVFRHRRIGAGGRAFPCYKFRTMTLDADRVLLEHLRSNPQARAEWELSHKLKRDPRVFFIGEVLRKSSMDELPQLLNVIRGEMSIVGPRPIVSAEVGKYGHDFRYYCQARPGMTGLWQISGRNDITYQDRIRLDRSYVLDWSFLADLRIILKTVPAVLMSQGSY